MTYPCADCGYVLRHDFVMPNDLWNEVAGADTGKILCYDCFCDRAEKKGYIPVFKCKLAHPPKAKRKPRVSDPSVKLPSLSKSRKPMNRELSMSVPDP